MAEREGPGCCCPRKCCHMTPDVAILETVSVHEITPCGPCGLHLQESEMLSPHEVAGTNSQKEKVHYLEAGKWI